MTIFGDGHDDDDSRDELCDTRKLQQSLDILSIGQLAQSVLGMHTLQFNHCHT